jgi:hypothetical protein
MTQRWGADVTAHRPLPAWAMRQALDALGLEPPRCPCHNEEMGWHAHASLRAGGRWYCRVQAGERHRRRKQEGKYVPVAALTAEQRDRRNAQKRVVNRRWRAANLEHARARDRAYKRRRKEAARYATDGHTDLRLTGAD